MTTGLDDGVPDNHCTLDTCLNYLAEAGSRWAYHNAPYTLLEKVLVNATGQSVNTFTQQKLKAQTGMTGLWYTVDYDNVFFSNVRSMARFGLLIQNKGAWSKDTLLHDTAYLHQMMNTSQSLNNSYGYLWWLNGKSSFMLPGVQIVFPGSWAPHAPADMVAGLGKNGQIVSISPSKSLVMVRMGNPPGSSGSEIPSQLCDQIWEKLNEVICVAGSVEDEYPVSASLKVYPNPASQSFTVELSQQHFSIAITDLAGRLICERKSVFDKIEINSQNFLDGTFFIRVINEKKVFNQRLVILQRQP
jgi:hypothetical protein